MSLMWGHADPLVYLRPGTLARVRARASPAIELDERSYDLSVRPTGPIADGREMARIGNEDAPRGGRGRGAWGGYRAAGIVDTQRDYFVRLCALNHPVGFLSRVDGSRSRIKACGLLRASIMTQSAIHLAPTPSPRPRGDLSFSLYLPAFSSLRIFRGLYVRSSREASTPKTRDLWFFS